MDIIKHNKMAWNREVVHNNKWTIPVSKEIVAKARVGEWSILMTPTKPVPKDWLPMSLNGLDILCLASGGGQQGPILAAAGGNVTVFDNSPKQLAQDKHVSDRDMLNINIVEGDMRDLSVFLDESFDVIVHPTSNLFIPDVHPVWKEAFRVLRKKGILISGFCNPIMYMFDLKMEAEGILQVKYKIPYSDLDHREDRDREQFIKPQEPIEFGHTLEDLIGGQIEAGFTITGFFEDSWGTNENVLLSTYTNSFIATRAVKT
jgi:SAM-dependent methyltransferase